MVTVATLKAHGMAAIGEITNKADFESCVKYIDFLAQSSGIPDVSGMPIENFSFSECGKPVAWPFTKKDINAMFMKWSDTSKTTRKETFKNPKLIEYFRKNQSTRIENISGTIRNYRSEADNYARHFTQNMSSIMSLMAERSCLESGEVYSFAAALGEDTFFEFLDYAKLTIDEQRIAGDIRNPCLQFITPEIVLRNKDDAAGIDISLNMGQFKLVITENFYIFVLPYKNNIVVSGIRHPHVNGRGHVCYGDQVDKMDVAIRTNSIGPILKSIQGILTQYNAESPYVSLSQFKIKRDEKDMQARAAPTDPSAPIPTLEDADEDLMEEDEDDPGF